MEPDGTTSLLTDPGTGGVDLPYLTMDLQQRMKILKVSSLILLRAQNIFFSDIKL